MIYTMMVYTDYKSGCACPAPGRRLFRLGFSEAVVTRPRAPSLAPGPGQRPGPAPLAVQGCL